MELFSLKDLVVENVILFFIYDMYFQKVHKNLNVSSHYES